MLIKEPGAFESPLKIEKQEEHYNQQSTDITTRRKQSVESMTAGNYLFKDSDSEGEREITLRIPSKSKPEEVPKIEECSPFENQQPKQPSQSLPKPTQSSKSKNKPPKISALKFR